MPTFPISFYPQDSFKTGGRAFGADRIDVLHPACDFISPPGTEIYAMEKGTIVADFTTIPKSFFHSGKKKHVQDPKFPNDPLKKIWVCDEPEEVGCLWVNVITVQHANYLARYCEISPKLPVDIKPGMDVVEGQLIAYVGKQSRAHMLHLELFSNRDDLLTEFRQVGNRAYTNLGTIKAGKLTYNRRRDLMDPTAIIDSCTLKPVIDPLPPSIKYHSPRSEPR